MGHLLEGVGYPCELQEPGVSRLDEEGEEELALMQASGSLQPNTGGGSPSQEGTRPATREEDLMAEERATIAACSADETWRALRSLRPEGKENSFHVS